MLLVYPLSVEHRGKPSSLIPTHFPTALQIPASLGTRGPPSGLLQVLETLRYASEH